MTQTNTLFIAFLFLLFGSLSGLAQESTSSNYYYNNFDGGQLGASIAQTSALSSLDVSISLPLAGGYSLASNGNNKAGSYRFSFVANGTSMNNNLEKYGWEWTLVYRNTGGNTDNPSTIDDNENSWRYWLYANSTDEANRAGYYLTQVGSSMNIYMRVSAYDTRLLLSYDLSKIGGNNTTYAIRVQRLNVNGYTFRLFIDPYTSTTKEASTMRAELLNSGENNNYNVYNYSGIQTAATSAGRFKFDEIKMYARKMEIAGANDASYGISSPLYNGQKDAVVYGLRFKTRGLFTEVYQIQLEIEQTGHYSFADIIENARLFRSFDNYFGNADDALINKSQWNGDFSASVGYRTLQANNFQTQTFYSVGTADGALADVGGLFFKVDIKSDASAKGTFNIKSLSKIGNDNSNLNYTSDPAVVNNSTTTTSPSASGHVYDWVGATSSWTSLSNWRLTNNNTPTVLPSVNDLVRIGVNKVFTASPVVDGNSSVGNLIIGGSSGSNPSVTIGLNTTLTVKGAFTNTRSSSLLGNGNLAIEGAWTSSGGKISLTDGAVAVKFTGTKSQAIKNEDSDSGNGVVFGSVVFSGGGAKTLAGKFAVAVNKGLTIGENTVLNANGNLTLKASALGTAYVNAIPSTSSIQGEVTVERYIQGGDKAMWRTYRMFSSPVYDNSASFINANVVGNRTYSFTQFMDDFIVTGSGGSANGFDNSPNNSASAWTYNSGFVALTNMNTSVNIGRGTYFFYRGNRDNMTAKFSSPYVDPESMVMNFKGVLNQQTVHVPLEHGSTGFSLVGNPYAATIDWNNVVKSGIGAIHRIWNPSNRQYSAYDGENGINGGARYIGSGQAFFVQTISGSTPSITFTEVAKVTDKQMAPMYNKIMSVKESDFSVVNISGEQSNVVEETSAKIRVFLERNGTENSDETLLVLKRGNAANFDSRDIARYGGEAVFLTSLSTDNKELAINYMPSVDEVGSIDLSVNVTNSGAYTLKFQLTAIPLGYEVKLLDKYLDKMTSISNDGTNYAIQINKNDVASFGTNRFEILLAPVTTLPVVLTDFSAARTNAGVALSWNTSSETNNSHFEVLRAGEDQKFISIGSVSAKSSGNYSWLDKSPLMGNNYYKLLQVDNDGTAKDLPKIATVKYELDGKGDELLVYPTVVTSAFTIKYEGKLISNNYALKIVDLTGKEVFATSVDRKMLVNGYKGELLTDASGIYFLSIADLSSGKNLGVTKLIKR